MGRNILLITTDQQRYDALRCNGGKLAQTPHIDALAASGIRYTQARNQCTTCMPARSTIITGQSIRRHGVTSNGIALPADQSSLTHLLKGIGYKTALVGKAHFEPHSATGFFENHAATEGSTGPHRGFDRMELSGHTGRPGRSVFHYSKWLADNHPEYVEGFHIYAEDGAPSAAGWTETGLAQAAVNPIPKALYHTHWTAGRAVDWLKGLADDDDWFCWMSFPDPHHPWDPPAEAVEKFPWRDVPLPDAYPGSVEKCLDVLDGKPRHWRQWYSGEACFNFEVPPALVPAQVTADQIREVNAMAHASNELIDEAVGLVMDYLVERGWDDGTDVFFTTDHGDFQGDFGMLFKGPYHIEGLMHVPFIWRPAPQAGVRSATVPEPVGHMDLAPTMAAIAELDIPAWMEGSPLPTAPGDARRERTITEWIDGWQGNDIVLETLYRDGWILTRYGKTNFYDGTEGELYNLADDPLQWRNLWDDASHAAVKSDLLADLDDHRFDGREDPLEKVAFV